MLRRALVLLPLLAGGWGPSEVGEKRVAVLPLQLEAALADAWQRQLLAGVLEGLARGNHELVEPSRVLAAAPDAASCRAAHCTAAIATTLGAAYVVRTTIEIEDRDFTVQLELLDGVDGRSLAKTGEGCDVCAVPEVKQLLAEHAAILGGRIDALTRAPPVVRFVSEPTGALIYLDGELIGEAPVKRAVPPGRHRVRAQLRGHLALEQSLDPAPATEETLRFELEPTPRRQRLRPWGWILLGSAIPTTVAGVTLIAIDEQPYRTRCTGDYVDAYGHCRLRYDTLSGGIVLTSIGVAGLVAATSLLVVSRPDSSRRRREARVHLQPGPMPTLVGRF